MTPMERIRERQRQARSDAMVRRHANAGNTSVRKICVQRLSRKRIDNAIAHLDLRVEGGRDGYFYFIDTVTDDQIGSNVMVCRLGHLTLEEWIAYAANARTSGLCNGIRTHDEAKLMERYGSKWK